MTYKLQVHDGHNQAYHWWGKFMRSSGFMNGDEGIDFYLAPHRARNVKDSIYIEFETEQDATLFILKFVT